MDDDAIAIVGMAGRVPGLRGLDGLWEAMNGDCDLITRFPVAPNGRVPAYGVVPDEDSFDAEFFGIDANEARLLDPQHRVLLECAWEAIEDAGYDPGRFDGHIGLYAGSSEAGHALDLAERGKRLGLSRVDIHAMSDSFEMIGRIAFHLGLTGPTFAVQAACASSSVAVHLACQALLAGDCDMAIAGGASIFVPHGADVGEPPATVSSDGHHRAVDARGDGPVISNGAGLIVLKRLADAIEDGDEIRALVRGSAVHNDGHRKPDPDGPSIEGVADVMSAACQVADVDPATIGYTELGSGFPGAGDIELAGMRRVFTPRTPGEPQCRVGSLKSIIGHTDAAAGVLSVIMLALALRHGKLPATVGLVEPNPAMDITAPPFYVSATVDPWPRGSEPRRAGAPNWGHGGVNTYILLEEPPEQPSRPAASAPHVLPISARTPRALHRAVEAVRAAVDHSDPADLSWTFQQGRARFARRACLLHPSGELIERSDRPIGFLRTGWSSSALAGLAALYGALPSFAAHLEAAASGASIDLRVALADHDRLRVIADTSLTAWWREAGVSAARTVDARTVPDNDHLWIALGDPADDTIVTVDRDDPLGMIARAAATVWASGHEVRWEMTRSSAGRRVAAPTYPFERQPFRLPPPDAAAVDGPRPRWLLSRTPEHPGPRLYCFPHSGGAAGEYMAWSAALPDVSVWTIQLPGRGSRLRESPIQTVGEIVEAIVAEVDFTAPFIFFGHSFGALVAYEVARALDGLGRPTPQRLILSACGAPETLEIRDNPIFQLDGDAFIDEMDRLYGAVPREIRDDPDLKALAVPALRADMEAAERYRSVPRSPSSIPISILGGKADLEDEEKLKAWSALSTHSTDVTMFPGGHFYFREHPEEFFAELARILATPFDKEVP